jgi:hypothetical protein
MRTLSHSSVEGGHFVKPGNDLVVPPYLELEILVRICASWFGGGFGRVHVTLL